MRMDRTDDLSENWLRAFGFAVILRSLQRTVVRPDAVLQAPSRADLFKSNLAGSQTSEPKNSDKLFVLRLARLGRRDNPALRQKD
jgi:hypothetical protein